MTALALMASPTAIPEIALRYFGVTAFRPGQRELLGAVLGGRDSFGILPTGGGKSLVFQLASLFLPRVVLVVTPLISLAEDQTDKLERWRIAARRIDSTLKAAEVREAVGGVARNDLDLVYVTPERLERRDFLELLREVGVSLIVVDEAHCVSQWGHDFRPAYLGIRRAAEALGRPPLLALTATATRDTESDVVTQLGLRDPLVVRTSAERPNLALGVTCVNAARKLPALFGLLEAAPGQGLVYATTIKAATAAWTALVERGVPAGLYHGDLAAGVRDATQDAFMDGRYRIMVATSAFGMGVDHPHVRSVVHWQLPGSLEAYAQEVGRAGRDREPARAELLFDPKDVRVHRFFLGQRYPRPRDLDAALGSLSALGSEAPFTAGSFRTAKVSERKAELILIELERREAIVRDGASFRMNDRGLLPSAFAGLRRVFDERRAEDALRLGQMVAYAEGEGCRTARLLAYFGEERTDGCGRCDECGGVRSWTSKTGTQ